MPLKNGDGQIQFNYSSWKGSKGIESTQKIYLVSTSEIKAGKEQFDHEVRKMSF